MAIGHCRLIPVPPGGGVVRQTLLGDVGQCKEGPAASLSIERRIIGVIDKLRYGEEALIVAIHAGFRQAASCPLAHQRRGIIVHCVEQGRDRRISPYQGQALDGPTARVFGIIIG